jgi:hypothetical protein
MAHESLSGLRRFTRPLRDFVDAGKVNDDRMIGWTTLGGEDLAHSVSAARIRTKSINRLGRKCHQPAGTEDPNRALDRCGVSQLVTSR